MPDPEMPDVEITGLTNGGSPSERREHVAQPSMEDVFMGSSEGAQFNVTKEMFSGALVPELYMGRTVFRDEEAMRDFLLEQAQIHRMTLGFSDASLFNWLELMAAPAVKGLARTQVMEMYMANRMREERMRGGMLARSRGLNGDVDGGAPPQAKR